MVKFERKDTPKSLLAQSILKLKNTYNCKEVNDALYELFHGKCYLCENLKVVSPQIEHLNPDDSLKFSWENLFLACEHCNNTKLARFPILNCCEIDVDEYIIFRYIQKPSGSFIIIKPRYNTEIVHKTCELLRDIYGGTTPQKQLGADTLISDIEQEMYEFSQLIRDYISERDADRKQDYFEGIKIQITNRYAYTAFKRWYIRDNFEDNNELISLLRPLPVI